MAKRGNGEKDKKKIRGGPFAVPFFSTLDSQTPRLLLPFTRFAVYPFPLFAPFEPSGLVESASLDPVDKTQ